ncbi:hypothetical protein ACH3XW_35020 [Acanthocheilonema viteae]
MMQKVANDTSILELHAPQRTWPHPTSMTTYQPHPSQYNCVSRDILISREVLLHFERMMKLSGSLKSYSSGGSEGCWI